MGRVVVEFVGKDSSLTAAQERTVKGAANITAEYKKIAAESAKLDREAAKVWEKTLTPLERYNTKLKELDRLLDSGRISQEQFARAAGMARHELQRQGDSMQALAASGFTNLTSMATGFLSVGSAVSFVTQMIELQNQKLEEGAKKAQEFAFANAPLAALLQPEEMKAFSVAAARAAPLIPMAEAGAMAQNFLSALEDQKLVLKTMELASKGTLLGMSTEQAKEVVAIARSTNINPLELFRKTVQAGILSARGTEEIAKAAPALPAFTDVNLGLAAATQLSGVRGMRVEESVRQAGIALEGVAFPEFAKWLKNRGVGPEATQMQRLEALVKNQITSPGAMQQVGITGMETQLAMVNLVRNFKEVLRFKAEIETTPENLVEATLARTVPNLPGLAASLEAKRQAREQEIAASLDEPAARRIAQNRAIAAELTRRGQTSYGAFDVVDAEGRLQPWGWWAMQMFGRGRDIPGVEMPRRAAIEAAERAGAAALQNIDRQTKPRPAIPAPER